MGQAKKPKVFDSHSRSQQGRVICNKKNRWACRLVGLGFYKCRQTGHMSRDCPRSALIFFQCNQADHKKADCPRFSGGLVVAPGAATLRITNGRQGKAEAPFLKRREF